MRTNKPVGKNWRIVLVLFVALGAVLAAWGWVPPDPAPGECAFDRNAAWIGVEWTSEPVDPTAVAALARDAQAHRLTTLYPFTTYLKPDGTFNPTFDHAAEFVTAFRNAADPNTQLVAWIGLPLANDRRFGIQGWVDLNDANQRAEIAAFAASLVAGAGFDGVHLDAETVRDGNLAFLFLLEELRAALMPGAMLSVAGSYWLPGVVNSLPPIRGHKWSPGYLDEVATRVDQIAIMTYDSVMPHPTFYRLWLREQVRAAVRGGGGAEILIGISASRERTQTHHPYAENVRSGVAGACSALRAPGHTVTGLALYAAWEATPEDWSYWDQIQR